MLIALAARDPRIGPEAATGVVVTGLVGLGALLALSPTRRSACRSSSSATRSGCRTPISWPPGCSPRPAGSLSSCSTARCGPAFDGDGAAALGLRPRLLRLALLGLVAARGGGGGAGTRRPPLARAARGAGASSAAPARSAGRAIAGGAAVGAAGGVVGIYVSHHADIAAGASVALTLCLAAVLGSRATPRRAAARSAGA